MNDAVKRYGVYKRLLADRLFCGKPRKKGDKYRVDMVLASDYDRDIKALRDLLGIVQTTMAIQEPRGPDDVRLSMYLDDVLKGTK